MPIQRTKRKIQRIPPSTVTLNESPIPEESSSVALEPDSEAPATRLSLPITTDGRIDAARLRDKTKSALRVALSDPALPVALGTPSLDTVSTVSAEDAALVKTITDSLFMGVSAASVLLAKRAGFKNEHAIHLVWDDNEKTQVAPLTGKIAQKWLPMLNGKYRDECLLGYQVITIIAMKIQLMREAAAQPARAEQQAS